MADFTDRLKQAMTRAKADSLIMQAAAPVQLMSNLRRAPARLQ